MSSRARIRWGIFLTVLVVFVVGFTSAAWMPGFAAERFLYWSGGWQRLRNSEEHERTENASVQNKTMGMEVRLDDWTGNAIYTLTESGAIAAAPAPPRYVLRTVKSAAGIHAYRLQPYTGEVWAWGDGDVWKQVAPGVAGGSLFDLVLTPVGDEGKVNVLRIQPNSGETWWINAEGGPKKLAEPPLNVTANLVGSQWSYGPDWKFDFGKTKIENFSNGWWAMVTWKVIGPNQIELTNPESLASKTMTMTFDTADSYTTTDWDGTKMTGRRLGPAASK